MQAVRTIHKVKNGSITIQLPPDFASDEVEVIVLPAQPPQRMGKVTSDDEEGIAAIEHFLAVDTSSFNEQQLAAYQVSAYRLREWLKTRNGRLVGAFHGLIEIADDFDSASEIEELFYADNIQPSLSQ